VEGLPRAVDGLPRAVSGPPRAVESLSRGRVLLEQWKVLLEQWRVLLEQWRVYWSSGVSYWSSGESIGAVESLTGAVEGPPKAVASLTGAMEGFSYSSVQTNDIQPSVVLYTEDEIVEGWGGGRLEMGLSFSQLSELAKFNVCRQKQTDFERHVQELLWYILYTANYFLNNLFVLRLCCFIVERLRCTHEDIFTYIFRLSYLLFKSW